MDTGRFRVRRDDDGRVVVVYTPFDDVLDFDAVGSRSLNTGHFVIPDMLKDGQVLLIGGVEGGGKSYAVGQLAAELTFSGHSRIWGHFERPTILSRVAIIDTEQTEDDAQIIRDFIKTTGKLEPGKVDWVDAMGRNFSVKEDQDWLLKRACVLDWEMLIVDAGTAAVSDPSKADEVKVLFDFLQGLIKDARTPVRTVIVTSQPRKRGQGQTQDRDFDDLYGSAVWKRRNSTCLWLDRDTITAWKNRGGYLRRRWLTPAGVRYPYATVTRTPFGLQVENPPTVLEAQKHAIHLIKKHPDRYARTGAAKAMGGKYEVALSIIGDLLETGVIGPNESRAKIHVVDEEAAARILGASSVPAIITVSGTDGNSGTEEA